MVDTPTVRNRLRKQELGTNVNTWGDDKLNEVIDAIDKALDGVESLALTGDKTLTTTNYTTADESLNRVLKFTGTLSSAANVIVPNVDHWYVVINAAGDQVTVKTNSGLGVAVPNGSTALVYCDGADVLNAAPTIISTSASIAGALTVAGKISGVTAATAAMDAVNKTQMEAAIAAQLTSGDGSLLVTSSDTTRRFLGGASGALEAGTGISLAVQNSGADETVQISSTVTSPTAGYTDGGIKTTSFTAVAGERYRILKTADLTITAPAFPNDGDKVLLEFFGTGGTVTWVRNGENVLGAAANNTIPSFFFGDKTMTFTTQASHGWF